MTKDAIDYILADAEAASLDKVLGTAPSLIADEDLGRVIDKLRRDRVLFMQAETGGGSHEAKAVQETDTSEE